MFVRVASEPAPGKADNEDQVLCSGDLVGVFDGVSEPYGIDSGCVHTVAWYVRRLASRLAEASDREPGAALTELLTTAIANVNADHNGQCDLGNPATPAATVCLLRKAGDRLDYLVLSDALLVIDDGRDISVITDPRFEQAITPIRREYVDGEGTRRKLLLTNSDEGYWIAAANPNAARQAVTGQLSLSAIRRAALLTDGAARAVDVFGLFGWRELLDLITSRGPQELIRRVRIAEMADPAGQNRSRFKKHDDASVVLCVFNQGEQGKL